jgi:hypothetical protein
MELDPGIHISSTWFVLETGCDTHQALFNDTRDQEAMEEAKLFYKMVFSAKIPLHDNTTVSQLDAIGAVVRSEI